MSKKIKKDINKIIENKSKSRKINIVYLIISIFSIGLLLLKNYISPDGIIESLLYYIITIYNTIFGNAALVFFLIVAIINGICVFLGNKTIRVNTVRKIFIILSFVFFSIFLTSISIGEISNNILDAGQDILSFGFLGKGGGLIGSISSIIFFKFINKAIFSVFSLFLAIIFGILGYGKSVYILYRLFSKTYSYYSSEEYLKKKELLKAKEEYYKNQRQEQDEKELEELTNFLVIKKEKMLDDEISKKPDAKDGEERFFNEDELNSRKKEWKAYFDSIEAMKEKKRLENEKLEQERIKAKMKEENERFLAEKENEKPYIEPKFEEEVIKEIYEEKISEENNDIYENEEIEEVKEPVILEKEPEIYEEIKEEIKVEEKYEKTVEPLNREIIEKSLANIFLSKNMDPLKKEEMKREITNNINLLEEVLGNFGVEGKVIDYATGPTVTRYEIQIPNNVKVKRVTELESEITMNLRAESIRIEAPIPGKAAIGIETPNKIKEPVYFSNLIHSPKMNEGILPVILGKDIIGRDKIIDIVKLPHLLIGGTTGSGKSICVNTIIASLITKKTDEEVKLILIDPKMVEMMPYNDIPHLLTPVITDAKTAAIALKWAVNEMENRYERLANVVLRKIEDYNAKYVNNKMPYIVIVIDELADLMMVAADSIEISIARLTQKARAVGIHLILATQRPSTDVVTGLIKSNLPSRIGFTLRSYIDSRTVLDQVGAEKLLGKGDMLFLDNGSPNLLRVQGAYISDEEVYELTSLLKKTKKAIYNQEVLIDNEENENVKTKDVLFDKAVILCKEMEDKPVSISYLQRELSLGFNRASRIIKQLKDENVLDEDNIYIGE